VVDGEQHRGRAKPTLSGPRSQESCTQRGYLIGRAGSARRGDDMAAGLDSEYEATAHRVAVEEDSAGAAHPFAAPILDVRMAENGPQHLKQRLVGLDPRFDWLFVEDELDL